MAAVWSVFNIILIVLIFFGIVFGIVKISHISTSLKEIKEKLDKEKDD